jgi:hypothetical protein
MTYYRLFAIFCENANMKEKIEDTKRVIRSCKSKKDRQYTGQKKKDKQLSTKHYTENCQLGVIR